MFSNVQSAALNGLEAYMVRVEADISDGMPQLLMVGYLSSEVREAGYGQLCAIQELRFPPNGSQ